MSTSSVPIVTQYSQASQQQTQSDVGGGVSRGVASGDVAGKAQLVEENDPRVAPNSNFYRLPDFKPAFHDWKPSSIEEWKHIVEAITYDDVIFGTTKIYRVTTQSNQGQVPLSRIHHIRGYLVKNLTYEQIRTVGTHFGIRNLRQKKKQDVCEELVDKILDARRKKSNEEVFAQNIAAARMSGSGTANSAPPQSNTTIPTTSTVVYTNYFRLVNVLSHDRIKPLLPNLCSTATRREIDDRRLPADVLHEEIAKLYNEANNSELKANKYGRGIPNQTSVNPGLLRGRFDKEKAKKAVAELRRLYTTSFYNYKRSGNHGDAYSDVDEDNEEISPPTDQESQKSFIHFVRSKYYLMYFHNFVEEANLSDLVLRLFRDPSVFSQSTNPSDGKKQRSYKKQKQLHESNKQLVEAIKASNALKEKLVAHQALAVKTQASNAMMAELEQLTPLHTVKKNEMKTAKANLKATKKVDGEKHLYDGVLDQMRGQLDGFQPQIPLSQQSTSTIASDSQRYEFGEAFLEAKREFHVIDRRYKVVMKTMEDASKDNEE